MSLPKNCLYTNKINSSYARNYQSVIQPQNGNDATFSDTIIFNIPTGCLTLSQISPKPTTKKCCILIKSFKKKLVKS